MTKRTFCLLLHYKICRVNKTYLETKAHNPYIKFYGETEPTFYNVTLVILEVQLSKANILSIKTRAFVNLYSLILSIRRKFSKLFLMQKNRY